MITQIQEEITGIDVVLPIPEDQPKQSKIIKLNSKHKEFRDWLLQKSYGDWNEQAQSMNTHTCHLREACEHFGLPAFGTESTGKDGASGRNCVIYPKEKGTWICYRSGGSEGKSWRINKNGNPYRLVGSHEVWDSSQPCIRISPQLDKNVEESIQALADEPKLYQRGVLVEIMENVPMPPQCLSKGTMTCLRPVSPVTLACIAAHAARWETFNKKEGIWGHSLPSDKVINAVHQGGKFPGVRHIRWIVNSPVLRPDGSIITTPGYDSETGIYLDSKETFPDLMPIEEATKLLEDVLADFPFASDTHKSGWYALLITLLSRAAFAGSSPFFLFDANISRVGKGLLTDVVTMIFEGRKAARYTYPGDNDEVRKGITTVVLSGAPYLCYDNISGRFGCSALEAAMTGGRWCDRILGVNERVDIPMDLTWFGTSNNALLTHDMINRTCYIRMETECEDPSKRSDFRHDDLLGFVEKNRAKLVMAALSIPYYYIQAGSPDQGLPKMGGFERWSGLVRNALKFAGLADPRDTQKMLAETADDDTIQLRQLIGAWLELSGEVTVAMAINRVEDNLAPLLSELLESLPNRTARNANLGQLLRKYRGRVVDGHKIVRSNTSVPFWFVKTIKNET